MNTTENIRTFVVAAESASFAETARRLGIAASVITKRIGQLEAQMGARLFDRSNRRISLTEVGEQSLPRFRRVLNDMDRALSGEGEDDGLTGRLLIKASRALDQKHLAAVLCDFHAENPNLTLDVMLLDHSLNPAGERYDLGLGILSPIYWDVTEVPLCPYERICCAAPSYLQRYGTPEHPRDLTRHHCLTYHTIGSTWSFATDKIPMRVDVPTLFTSNDTELLCHMACQGRGIVVLARHRAAEAIEAGNLVEVMPNYPLLEFWLKLLIPHDRAKNRNVRALCDFLKERFAAA